VHSACRTIREDILKASHTTRHGHIPTCFSVVEMLYTVYQVMVHDPARPEDANRDIFILSKGHAALAHYCVLAHLGYFPETGPATMGQAGSNFGCHADRTKVPGVEASAGSLGHGIGMAVGVALAFRLQHSPRKVYTLIGDGESNEGAVWEAIMAAASLGLSNLRILFDFNMSQTRCLQITNPAERFRAFGCETIDVNGHDVEALVAALSRPADRPTVIVARTTKGYGCPTLVNDMFAWHRRAPNDEELGQLMAELHA
jgi:transketolase